MLNNGAWKILNREWKSLLIKSELYEQNGSQRGGNPERIC
jgi:hypothetical protein